MKRNKKWIALFLSTALAVSALTGCADSDDNSGNSGANSADSGSEDNGSSEDSGNEESGEEGGEDSGSSTKTRFDDLGGMTIKIGDWYSPEEEDTTSTQYAEDRYNYRQDIYSQYNFTVERKNISSWVDMPQKFTTEVMSNDPSVDIWYLYQTTVAEPLKNNLLYDLSTVKSVDFSEEKWNKQVTELMTYNGGIYGMSTEMEPRAGLFYNKRLFEEAGIPKDEPYELQEKGEWTWDKLEEYCKKLTQDKDKDGTPDVYAMASFSKDYFKMLAATNGAQFVSRDENGKYVNATKTQNFIDAANWGVSLIEKGYIMPDPEGASWDWFITAFRDGDCAMQTAEVYTVSSFADSMEDDFGFVMFPAGPNGNMATVPLDNILVIPYNYDAETVEKIMFGYDLYTEPAPGYTLDDEWKATYNAQFRDPELSVDGTLELMRQEEHRILDYQPMIPRTDYGDFTYSVYARAKTPQEQLEEMTPTWDARIKDANEGK